MIQNAGEKLSGVILHQVEKGAYFCTAENISPNQAVHELRKLFKRLRALLRFYHSVQGNDPKTLRDEMKHFGRLLSPLRESFVNANLFENELRTKKIVPERKMRWAGEQFFLKNKKLVGSSLWDQPVCRSIRPFLSRLESRLEAAGSRKITAPQIVSELNHSYQKGYYLFRELPDHPSAEAMHSLRKKLKRLYYQLDFVRLFHPKYFKLKSEQLNLINDQLGNDHDLHVLSEELLSEDYGFSGEEKLLLKNQVEHLRELNQLKLRPRLKQFFSESPEAFNQKSARLMQH